MVAMMVSLFDLGPHHCGLDGDQQAEGRSTRTAWPQRQRRMAGQRLSWPARNACQRRGRKSTDRHCGKVIEAKPTLRQISPSEAAMAPADRPRGELVAIGGF